MRDISSKAEEIQAAETRILALMREFPYWQESTLARYLTRKRHMMSRRVYIKAIRALLTIGDLVQPRAGVICRCSASSLKDCASCDERRVNLLVHGEPTSSPVVMKTCRHSWELVLEKGTFALTCRKCKGSVRAWRSMPKCLSDVLVAAAQFPKFGVNEQAIKQVAGSVHPDDKARAWDTFATIKTVLAVKGGQPDEGLWIKSKMLTKFVELCKNDSGLATLPRATQRRYGFAVRVLQDLPVWLQP